MKTVLATLANQKTCLREETAYLDPKLENPSTKALLHRLDCHEHLAKAIQVFCDACIDSTSIAGEGADLLEGMYRVESLINKARANLRQSIRLQIEIRLPNPLIDEAALDAILAYMDGITTLLLAVKSLEARKKSRMDIDHPSSVLLEQAPLHYPHESGEAYEANTSLLAEPEHLLA